MYKVLTKRIILGNKNPVIDLQSIMSNIVNSSKCSLVSFMD